MNTLEKIIATKKLEVEETKKLYPTKLLEQSLYFNTSTVSLNKYLLRKDKSGIIAEIKKQSPSKGIINKYLNVEKTSIGYMQAGASAISVLTDKTFFGGCNEDLRIARKFNFCPILRKEFIIDEYQIIEAKSIGADAILLIAACLTKTEINSFTNLAAGLGLEVLLEIHDETEIEKTSSKTNIIGINNRNLKTLKINLNTSFNLADKLPKEKTKVAESGIETIENILKLKKIGYSGFLIGSHFMKYPEPSLACKEFISSLQNEIHKKSLNYAN
ncbi:MAG: indole-3-glycerol phosphate synthase TrpC [Bacteroidota bacterium]|nr:indole-3-glycerol phosphate synthase TrpC [Bacteroidota bacterium]